MKKAKFKLNFETEAYFDIGREMEVALPNGSKIVFHKSKGRNLGTIFFEINEPDESIARNIGQEKVENFFTCLLVTKANFENLKPIIFPQKPELLNPEDFKEVPIKRYANLKMAYGITVKLEQRELDATSEFLAKLDKLPREKREIISRSLRWFRKASEANGEDRFIYRWISFEALVGLVEEGKLPVLLNQYLTTPVANEILEKHKETVNELSRANLISLSGVNRSEKLRELLVRARGDPKAILIKAILCIREVRHILFHKGEVLELMKGSSSLLRDIIRECLKFYVQHATC